MVLFFIVIAHKLTALVDVEGIFRYVSHLVPAGRHDIDCMCGILPELQSILDFKKGATF
jgi:hypothetical protein